MALFSRNRPEAPGPDPLAQQGLEVLASIASSLTLISQSLAELSAKVDDIHAAYKGLNANR